MDTDARRNQFVAAALELYAEKGIAQTTIGDISNRVGVARSLFYHYFPSKTAITQAVVDDRVADLLMQFESWAISYDKYSSRASLATIVSSVREYLCNPESFTSIMVRNNNDTLRHLFTVKSAMQLAQRYAHMKASGLTNLSEFPMRHPQESFYVLAVGLISIMSRYPEVPDEALVDIIADALHVDLC